MSLMGINEVWFHTSNRTAAQSRGTNKSINNPSTRNNLKHDTPLRALSADGGNCWIHPDRQQWRQAGGGPRGTAWPQLSAVSHPSSSAPQKLDGQVNPLRTEASPFCQVSGKEGKNTSLSGWEVYISQSQVAGGFMLGDLKNMLTHPCWGLKHGRV